MSDYINRRDVIKLVEKAADGYEYLETEVKLFIDDINAIKPADVQPVVRGLWEDRCTAGIEETVCSECLHGGFHHYNFCPNCGARMGGTP